MERYDEAEKECRKAVKLDSDNADFHDSIGELFSKTKRSEEAKIEFEIAKSLFAKQKRDNDVKRVEEFLKYLESL